MKISIINAFIFIFIVTFFMCVTPGCSYLADSISNRILANAISFDDREMPHTAYAILPASDNTQVIGGQGLGISCSIPSLIQWGAFDRSSSQAPIALQMRQACAFHDYCYRHGDATYNYTQADCDYFLQEFSFRLCKFINKEKSISECETNARKVTLGVRIGGASSFKRAEAVDDSNASTFFEFDPYPVRSDKYSVTRIADAPKTWVENGFFPKAAYFFNIKPSGTFVSIVGWKQSGELVRDSFQLPANYSYLNAPPIVMRDNSEGEDWFFWWRRSALSNTSGEFALLPPGRATEDDWREIFGGYLHAERNNSNSFPSWLSDEPKQSVARVPSAFVISNKDFEFSEIHAAPNMNQKGILHLSGITTHSCGEENKNKSECLVDIWLDTYKHAFSKRPTKYHLNDSNCEGSGSCDRYRDFVSAPFQLTDRNGIYTLWLRRGNTPDGEDYSKNTIIRRFSVGNTFDDPAINLGESILQDFPEEFEPAVLLDQNLSSTTFLSLVAEGENDSEVKMHINKIQKTSLPPLSCFKNISSSWITRTPILLDSYINSDSKILLLSKVDVSKEMFEATHGESFSLNLKAFRIQIPDGDCSELGTQNITINLKDALINDDKNDLIKALYDRDNSCSNQSIPSECKEDKNKIVQNIFGKFMANIRGGQMIVTDMTNDKTPDIVIINKIKSTSSVLLIGKPDKNRGLNFKNI